MTKLRAGPLDLRQWQKIFVFSEASKLARGHTQPPTEGYEAWGEGRGGVPVSGQSGLGVKLTIYLHIVPRFRTRGVKPPFPMAWCLVKH